ncbi:hypothetical protein ACHAPA_003034 [Fusarium lateritium]
MGKNKNKGANKASNQCNLTALPLTLTLTTTSAIAKDPILGYRVRVLLYDFLNVMKDPNSEKRINSTTNEYYISGPYFDETQATTLKAAIIDVDLGESDKADNLDQVSYQGQSFETAVRALLSSFIDKRRASGDTRPCGPHHLGPMYAKLFGIDMDELKDAKFLGRLRRAGLQ